MKGTKCPIRKRKSGKRKWMLDLRYIGGKRVCFETEQEAKNEREKMLAEFKAHGTSALALSNDERIDFVRARDELKLFNATIADAVAFFKKHHSISQPIMFAVAIDQVYKIKSGAGKDSEYVRKFKAKLRNLML